MFRVLPVLRFAVLTVAVPATVGAMVLHMACAAASPPAPIADAAFWNLVQTLSEPPRDFAQPDNLVSNEPLFAEFARLIRRRGGAYIGVGPEQNFSYIARLEPDIAFIVDIRQDNRNLHLMYKALFEEATDRASFLSLLFSRTLPAGTPRDISVADLFDQLERAEISQAALDNTKRSMREQLLAVHGFPLSSEDLASIDAALDVFSADGPAIRYGRSLPAARTRPSYRRLMTTEDMWGNPQSYLATEDAFAAVRALHTANRIVPVVGDFAGSHTIRKIGDFLRLHQLPLSAFYGSNVEVYLTRTARRTFCGNLATLPFDEGTHFIGNRRLLMLPGKLQACARIQPSLPFPELGGSR